MELTFEPAFPTSKLRTYYKNPRRGDVEEIKKSLAVNGQYKPIVVNVGSHTGRKNEVLAGNHTLAAARDLGWVTIAVSMVDVDEDQAKRIVLVDNRTGDKASYDLDELAELLDGLDSLDGTGYTDADLESLLAGEDDDAPEPEPEGKDTPRAFGVVVMVSSEAEQLELMTRLLEEGLPARAL